MKKLMEFFKTSEYLPPKGYNKELLGYGNNISGHVKGMFSIMRFDGDWWGDDGTELSDSPPEYWCYLPLDFKE
jgi:hypothetical protein